MLYLLYTSLSLNSPIRLLLIYESVAVSSPASVTFIDSNFDMHHFMTVIYFLVMTLSEKYQSPFVHF